MPSDFWDFLLNGWEFLRDKENRAVLAFLGAGAAAVIVAGWTVYTFRSATKSDNAGPSVKNGLGEEEARRLVADAHRPLTEKLEKISDQIAEQKGIPAAPLHSVLEKLGEIGVPDHEIPSKLDAAADQLIELREQLSRLTNDWPELAAEGVRRKEADFLADDALTEHLRRINRAAEKYAAAAGIVAPFDRETERRFLMAAKLHDLGKELDLYQALILRPSRTSAES